MIKISKRKKLVISSFFIAGGYGTSLHAIAGELYDKAGYKEILSIQGEWIGMAILAIGIFLSIKWLWKLK
jgi:hypothetical protein